MRAIDRLKDVASRYLYASIPSEYRKPFRQVTYYDNMARFETQSFVVFFLDLFSLITYMLLYQWTGTMHLEHIVIHVVKMAVMLLLFIYCDQKQNKEFKNNLFDKNFDVIYPAIHGILELSLYALGSQGYGALIRLYMVPIIMVTIPIINQAKALLILLFTYFIFIGYTVLYGTTPPWNAPELVLNGLVVLLCANLISNLIYSGHVNNYIIQSKELEAKDELNLINQKLDLLSRCDQLTGLSNRRDFHQYMTLTWQEAQEKHSTATFFMLDIDFFKSYNDRFGHVAGDKCLIRVAKTIKNKLNPAEHLFARYGGEEFIIVTYDKEHRKMVALAEGIRKAIEKQKIENPDSEIAPYLTMSLGVFTYQAEEGSDYQDLINRADECLYFAKRSGRNRVIHSQNYEEYYNVAGESFTSTPPKKLSPTEATETFEPLSVQDAIEEIRLDCTFLYSRKQGLLEFSPLAREYFGMPSNIQNPTVERIVEYIPLTPASKEAVQAALNKRIEAREKNFSLEMQLDLDNDMTQTVSLRARAVYDADGNVDILSGSLFSTKSLLAYNQFVQQHANLNMVTMLPNRNQFNEDMETVLLQPDSTGYIVIFDIKNFKLINGMYNHSIGDKLLRETGNWLSKLFAGQKLYNYSVDQFILIAQNADQDTVKDLTSQVHRYFQTNDVLIDGAHCKINFSVGAVSYNKKSKLEELLIDLDIALQRAKLDSANNCRFFTNKDRVEYLEQANLIDELKAAISSDFKGFSLAYQPIVDTKTLRWVGCEALLRWVSPQGESVPPMFITGILEDNNLMSVLEKWIINKAAWQCGKWLNAGFPDDFFIQVNLSAKEIARATLFNEVMNAIEIHELSLHNIVLEVTETSIMMEMEKSINILNLLQEQGIRIAIDDFGTGYSSLSYLQSLPVDEIKIDKSFIDDIETDPSAQTFLESIIKMSKSSGCLVCAEGVETQGQADIIKQYGVDFYQGFLFSRPIPPSEFAEKLLSQLDMED